MHRWSLKKWEGGWEREKGICLWFHSWGQICKLTHPSFLKAPGEVWSSFITSKQIIRSFSNRWQMMGNNILSLLHAKGWGVLKYKFHQFLKPQLRFLLLASSRTEDSAQSGQASGLLQDTPGGRCLEKENLRLSPHWAHWALLTSTFSWLLVFAGKEPGDCWLQRLLSCSSFIFELHH